MRCKILALLDLSFCAAYTHAQFVASIQGTVVDKSGGAVAGANVTVTNPDTGINKTTVTGDTGFYRVSALVPGKYTITVEAAGFKKELTNGVFVSAEELTGHDIVLQLGAVSESVTVSGDAITLNSENANVAGSISAQDIQRLPEVGRDPYELLRLAPGVLGDNARGGATNNATFLPGTEQLGGASKTGIFQTENQPQISANGQRVSSNNYEIDGVSVNSLGLGGAAVVTPSQESVKEVKVITSTYSAEDGRNSGAQIKVISQNGTNQFHGSGVLVFDDKGLNAFNKFFGPTNIPASLLTCQDNVKVFASRCPQRVDTKQRLFGGSLGGPVLKDKLFFFFSYEGLRRNDTTFTNEWIETPEFRAYEHQVRPGSLADRLFSLPGVIPRVVTGGLTPPSPPNGNAVQGQLGLSYDIGSINVSQGQKVDRTNVVAQTELTLHRVAVRRTGRSQTASDDAGDNTRKAKEAVRQAPWAHLVHISPKFRGLYPFIGKSGVIPTKPFVGEKEE